MLTKCHRREIHSSRTAVRLPAGNSTHLEDALQEGIVGSETVVGGGTPTEQEGHGVPLIPKGGLDTDEHIAKLLAIDQQILALGVQLACTTRGRVFDQATEQNQNISTM